MVWYELMGITVHPPAAEYWEDEGLHEFHDDDAPDVSDEQLALLESFRTAQRDETTQKLMVVERQAATYMRAARRNAAQGPLAATHRPARAALVEARRGH
jgi:hypothetical protein